PAGSQAHHLIIRSLAALRCRRRRWWRRRRRRRRSRLLDYRRRRRGRHIGRRRGPVEAQLSTERHAPGARPAEERAVELRRNGIESGLDAARRARALERGIESHLDEVLVEQVLTPELYRPGVRRSVDPDAPVEDGERFLSLLDVEIRARIEAA